ncbi:MAG: hypothetical protein ACREUT_02865 [Steroidobacteraceae bacterium]
MKEGVGKDNISDFTVNLIKGWLCRYTQEFALEHIDHDRLKKVSVRHAEFNYETGTSVTEQFVLPYIDGDFVLLSPKDILTKDSAWINRQDMLGDFEEFAESIENSQLRSEVNDYFRRLLPRDPDHKDRKEAAANVIRNFPELVDYYIRLKEQTGNQAVAISEEKVRQIEDVFVRQVGELVNALRAQTQFYQNQGDTYSQAMGRVQYLKQVIENNDGYRVFYVKGKPVKREKDLHIMFRLTWFASQDAVDAEVNNGRGPVDFKISRGAKDSTLVGFKLASNPQLKKNLGYQVEIYQAANKTDKSIKVIMCFSEAEQRKVTKLLNDLGLTGAENIVVIDASPDKPSASVAGGEDEA